MHEARRMKRVEIACLGLVACSTAPRPIAPDTSFPDRCQPSACATGPTISAPDQLVTLIDATPEWVFQGPYTTGCLASSDNILTTGTLTVQADSIAVPAPCQDRGDCRKLVKFRLSEPMAGVECVGPEQWYDFTLCAGITLHDATVRLRMLQIDIHPSEFGNFAPIVEVIPACEAPCSDTEVACEATHTCWADARDHCAYCLGGSNEACACWDGTAFAADGTECEFFVSGDVIQGGKCQAGTCVAIPYP